MKKVKNIAAKQKLTASGSYHQFYEKSEEKDFNFLIKNFPQIKYPNLEWKMTVCETFFFKDGETEFILQNNKVFIIYDQLIKEGNVKVL